MLQRTFNFIASIILWEEGVRPVRLECRRCVNLHFCVSPPLIDPNLSEFKGAHRSQYILQHVAALSARQGPRDRTPPL